MQAVAERPGKDVNFLPSHLAEFGGPKVVPEWVVRAVRDAGVKSNLSQVPILLLANQGSQCRDIVVWIRVSERVFGGVKKILAVNEDNGALECGFSGHNGKNNPARGRFQRVERGVDKSKCSRTGKKIR